MNSPLDMLTDLHGHLAQCRKLLHLVEQERQSLGSAEAPALKELYAQKRALLPELDQSTARLRRHREAWTRLDPADRARQPELQALIRQVQDVIMRVIVLDRENEQSLLRRGLMAPGTLPSVNQQRPAVVADLYRQGANSHQP
ncbi:MAG TPA: flagellar export chaperone FlgN [Methylomirabilota bacterium]|nr:flagellar export chaperone FlgN [Methylomirabilota bacterium]